MRKLLVVAYYTPPLGMSGVMRVTKLVKFLPRFGWEPLVLTVKRIAYYHYDERLLTDWKDVQVFRAGSVDPARLWYLLLSRRPVSQAGASRPSWLANVLCFPDAKAGWYPFAVRLGERVLLREKPDAIFATAPPFTTLMVGAELKKLSGLPLISDFRDPWPTGFLPPPALIRPRIERFRSSVLRVSDTVLAVNHGTAGFLEGRAEVLENGFDPEEFAVPARKFDGFTIVHVGNVWENEKEFRQVLEATRGTPGVQVLLVGRLRDEFKAILAGYPQFRELGLLSHEDAVAAMKGADLLLYLSKPGQAAGIKLYEYLGAGRPILSVCEECTEAARLVEQHHAGLAIGADADEIRDAVAQAMRGRLSFAPTGIERYSRLNQAERLTGILTRIVESRVRLP